MDSREISERDAQLVRAIEEEGLSTFTFDGLRRLTGSHPETLSRSLGRLEDEGVVAKSPDGYVVASKVGKVRGVAPQTQSEGRVQILRTYLPVGVSASSVVDALRGRWFDRMRWIGMADAEGGVVLKWLAEDGSSIMDVKLTDGEMEIEARIEKEGEVAGAVMAAHQLVARISRMYARPRASGRQATMRVGLFRPYAM